MKVYFRKLFTKLFIVGGLLFLLGAGVVGGVLVLAYGTAHSIYEYEDSMVFSSSEKGLLPDVDVIVCLAGGRGRIALASELWSYYRRISPESTPVLFLSGMGKYANWDTLSVQVKPDVLKNLSFQDVVLETESMDTIQNAEKFLEFAEKRKWSKFLIVTSSYHMKRSLLVFQTVLGRSKKIDRKSIRFEWLSVDQPPFTQATWKSTFNSVYVTLSEYLKLVFFRASQK